MGIEPGLKNLIEHGDWKIIADLFNKTHTKHVTASYILKVVNGERRAREGTAAAEILPFVERYLLNRKEFKEKITNECQ